MCPTKKVFFGLIVATLSLFHGINGVFAENEETFFVTTAYYSPLPDQSHYTTGSYAGDIRLNGSGKITASGKEVFQGLLAGPKNYPFGTKIYFQGYGIGEVADRGGAIVKAGERGHSYDRIDIWMGYGDEGLARALKWGTRTIKGKIVVPSAEISLKLGESPLGYFDTLRVHPKSGITEISRLQEIFTKADLYDGEIDGDYQSIRNELIEFQLKNKIISGYADEAAGYFGPKTIKKLQELYPNTSSILIKEDKDKFSKYNHKQASKLYKIILEYGDLQVNPDSDTDTVEKLQELLIKLGEYSGKIDGNYASVEQALIRFQKKIGLIKKDSDWGAGYFGNKTKIALWTYYEKQNNLSLGEAIVLSSEQKEQITKALRIIRNRLKGIELRGGKKMEVSLRNLNNQINSALKQIDDPLIHAKLLYLQEIMK